VFSIKLKLVEKLLKSGKMKLRIFLILELQMLLQKEKTQKPNFLKEWLIDIQKKITL
jgi:hypothetical protein